MKYSTEWLAEWGVMGIPLADLAERLTMAGLEIDSMVPVAEGLAGAITARIVAVARHPAADKLVVCAVDAGGAAPVSVVCGAPNARAGLCVVYAPPGSHLPGERRIEAAAIRGVASAGMLCSAAELGLGDDASGLLELPADTAPGRPLSELARLPDTVLDVDLTPNRGDCLSLHGLAREIGVLTARPVRALVVAPVAARSNRELPVAIAAPAACPRYAGRVIEGVDLRRPTPLWMRERLRRCGVRSINVVVDVTNYVMLETGQPMHAFDLAKLAGGIEVRLARAGEHLTLLDGQQVALDPDTLVIADQREPVALAGVMGGLASGVEVGCESIFLESALFEPVALAGVARRYRLHTDAAHRFERGVDPQGQVRAIERATALMLDLCGGVPGPVTVAEADAAAGPASPTVPLRLARVEAVLGVALPVSEVMEILTRLGCELSPAGENAWSVAVPTHRHDLEAEVDLVEELARIRGYARLPATLPRGALVPTLAAPGRRRLVNARQRLADRGYFEAITYGFIAPELQAMFAPGEPPLALSNPIAQDMGVMRPSLWPGLLGAARHNLHRQQSTVRLFELGRVFRRTADGVRQELRLGGLAVGGRTQEHWDSVPALIDFFDVKQDVVEVLREFGWVGCETRRWDHPALHPGKSAALYHRAVPVAWLGALHPALGARLELVGEPLLFEIAVERPADMPPRAVMPLSRFPSVRRDLSVVVAEEIPAAAILDCAREAGGGLLRDLQLFDVYRGQGIDSGKKSLALGLIFQAASSTLTEQQIETTVVAVLEAIRREVGGTLRA